MCRGSPRLAPWAITFRPSGAPNRELLKRKPLRMPPSILIVDDEQAVCWALERAFSRAGYRVAVAPSAEAAFDLARRDPPDAVVLDVRLPGMDGLTALARLRQLSDDAPV